MHVTRHRALALAIVAATSACGGGARSDRRAAPAASSVRITLDRDGPGGTPSRTATLRCASASERPACARLESMPRRAFEPVPADAVCTAIYGGPGRATISGVVARRRVDATYTRTDGCEIARWELVEPVLAVARGG